MPVEEKNLLFFGEKMVRDESLRSLNKERKLGLHSLLSTVCMDDYLKISCAKL